MFSIMHYIVKYIETEPLDNTIPISTNQILETLWGMKDRAVTIRKCTSMMQLLLEDSRRIGALSQKQIQNMVTWCLDFLYAYSLISLRRVFKSLSSDMRTLLYYVHQNTAIRSNWLELYTYRPGWIPGMVSSTYEQYEKDRAKWKSVEESLDKMMEGKEKVPEIKRSELDYVSEKFRQLAVWADGLEGTIDYLFEQWIQGSRK